MTPEEFRFASREFHTLLNTPAELSGAGITEEEFAADLKLVPEQQDEEPRS